MSIVFIAVTIVFSFLISSFAPNGDMNFLFLKGIVLGIASVLISDEISLYIKIREKIIPYIKQNRDKVYQLAIVSILAITAITALDYVGKIFSIHNYAHNVYIYTIVLYLITVVILYGFYKRKDNSKFNNISLLMASSELWISYTACATITFIAANHNNANLPLVLLIAFIQVVSFFVFGFAFSDITKASSYRTMKYSEKDIERAAYHEAGHSLLYCAFSDIPEWFYSRVNFTKDGRSKLGETARFKHMGGVALHRDSVFDMLMLLGGNIAESAMIGEKSNGNILDVETWQIMARQHLISSQRFLYYSTPQTQLEQNRNDESIKRLFIAHHNTMCEVVNENRGLLMKLANMLIDENQINSEDIIEVKHNFIFPPLLKKELGRLNNITISEPRFSQQSN